MTFISVHELTVPCGSNTRKRMMMQERIILSEKAAPYPTLKYLMQ